MRFYLKSVHDDPEPEDGMRILVDRLWPRGMSRERLRSDGWEKDLAPSSELRRWFRHDPGKWVEFQRRYALELDARQGEIAAFIAKVADGRVTLLFAARDRQHNNAVVLRDYLEQSLSSGARSGKGRP